MEALLRCIFYYKDGTSYEMKVSLPADVADKIGIAGLAYISVFVDAKISNIKAKLNEPKLEDFVHKRWV